jgi:hypothetical protein
MLPISILLLAKFCAIKVFRIIYAIASYIESDGLIIVGFSFRICDCIGSCIPVCHCHDWSHNSAVFSEVSGLHKCSQVSACVLEHVFV